MCNTQVMHEYFMRRCLQLATRGRGKTGINPMVGAVLVREGKIVAEGFHREFGKAHAEKELLEKFEQKIYTKDTLYVNLEPCCHTEKKTPPCTELLIQSGVKHLVFGMRDPNPNVSGRGLGVLRASGIEVMGPVLEDECRRLNRGFLSLQESRRPWITFKVARTLTGKVAHDDGSMMKITSTEQNAWSHEFLRARHDAILVGVGTILTDDSRLTIRSGSEERVVGSHPYRIVLDPMLRIPFTARVVNDDHVTRTIIVCALEAGSATKSELRSRGAQVIECPMHQGDFDFSALWRLLITPKDLFYGISSILVEGGPKTWDAFWKAGMVDEEITLIGE